PWKNLAAQSLWGRTPVRYLTREHRPGGAVRGPEPGNLESLGAFAALGCLQRGGSGAQEADARSAGVDDVDVRALAARQGQPGEHRLDGRQAKLLIVRVEEAAPDV